MSKSAEQIYRHGGGKISATLDDKFLKDCKFVKRDSWICKKEIGAFPRKLRLFKSERLKQRDLGNKPKQGIKNSN